MLSMYAKRSLPDRHCRNLIWGGLVIVQKSLMDVSNPILLTGLDVVRGPKPLGAFRPNFHGATLSNSTSAVHFEYFLKWGVFQASYVQILMGFSTRHP